LPSKQNRDTGDDEKETKRKEANRKQQPVDAQTKLNRLGELAGATDYWRNQSSALLFARLAQIDQVFKESTADYAKVRDGWDELVEKVHEVKTTPKVANALNEYTHALSSRNPWRIVSLTGGFIAVVVLIAVLYLLPPGDFLPIVITAFILLIGLQFYGTHKIRKSMRESVDTIDEFGGTAIVGISETCKDLTQTIINTLTLELPKIGRASDTYTLTLLSNDYSNVKMRVQEKVKKNRRRGDLYSIVWK
jgi:hypothetical protein